MKIKINDIMILKKDFGNTLFDSNTGNLQELHKGMECKIINIRKINRWNDNERHILYKVLFRNGVIKEVIADELELDTRLFRESW